VRLAVDLKGGLTVTIPQFFDSELLPDILARKSSWILRKLVKFNKMRSNSRKELKSGDHILYLGQRIRLVMKRNGGTPSDVSLEGKRLLVHSTDDTLLDKMLEGWYRRQAEQMITQKAGEFCPGLGVRYSRLRIRSAKTRWGSCSKKGSLNFNWKLMMAPERVIDYVVIHELAHLKELNHSKRFWALVAGHCPDWKKRRKWLEEHEVELASIIPGE
jgi:predicted metal-dependent hydrolase